MHYITYGDLHFITINFTELKLKGIQDKNSVTYFWLANFSLLYAADFQANSIDISYKK